MRPKKGTQGVVAAVTVRRSFHPGVGRQGLEVLETRQLLSGTDLTQIIDNYLGQTPIPSHVVLSSDATLGNFLDATNVTLDFNITQPGPDWKGSVTVGADSASLSLGSIFSGSITGDAQHQQGLTATYTLDDQPFDQGSYSLTAVNLSASVSTLLTATASNVDLSYLPGVSGHQMLAKVGSVSATFNAFGDATAALDNLEIDTDGFSLDGATLNPGDITLGSVLSVSKPKLMVSNLAYTVGSQPSGTVDLTADSVNFFPGQKALTANVQGFHGHYDLSDSAVSLSATEIDASVGNILTGTAMNPTFRYDPGATSGSPLTVTAGSIHVTSPDFPKVAADATNLQVNNTGLSFDSAALVTTPRDHGGPRRRADARRPECRGQRLQVRRESGTGTPQFDGTVTVSTTGVSLLPGNHPFTTTLDKGVKITYGLNSGALSVMAPDVEVLVQTGTAPDQKTLLDVTATGVDFDLTPQPGDAVQVDVTVGTAQATLPQFGVSGDAHRPAHQQRRFIHRQHLARRPARTRPRRSRTASSRSPTRR